MKAERAAIDDMSLLYSGSGSNSGTNSGTGGSGSLSEREKACVGLKYGNQPHMVPKMVSASTISGDYLAVVYSAQKRIISMMQKNPDNHPTCLHYRLILNKLNGC